MNHLTFHVRSIDVNEGAIHASTISWHSWRASIVLITSLVCRQTTCSTWILTIHVRRFRCDHPCKLLSASVSVGSRSCKPRPRGGLCHPQVTIVCRHRLRPVARVHLLFHIQLHCHPPFQNSCRQVALPQEAPMFVGTLSAQMVAGRNCLARRVM